MIVRIMGEGQYDVPATFLNTLNALDDLVESAVSSGDEQAFAASFAALLAAVRAEGATVADDALVDSELVLPPADASVDEVAQLLGDEGLIPG